MLSKIAIKLTNSKSKVLHARTIWPIFFAYLLILRTEKAAIRALARKGHLPPSELSPGNKLSPNQCDFFWLIDHIFNPVAPLYDSWDASDENAESDRSILAASFGVLVKALWMGQTQAATLNQAIMNARLLSLRTFVMKHKLGAPSFNQFYTAYKSENFGLFADLVPPSSDIREMLVEYLATGGTIQTLAALEALPDDEATPATSAGQVVPVEPTDLPLDEPATAEKTLTKHGTMVDFPTADLPAMILFESTTGPKAAVVVKKQETPYGITLTMYERSVLENMPIFTSVATVETFPITAKFIIQLPNVGAGELIDAPKIAKYLIKTWNQFPKAYTDSGLPSLPRVFFANGLNHKPVHYVSATDVLVASYSSSPFQIMFGVWSSKLVFNASGGVQANKVKKGTDLAPEVAKHMKMYYPDEDFVPYPFNETAAYAASEFEYGKGLSPGTTLVNAKGSKFKLLGAVRKDNQNHWIYTDTEMDPDTGELNTMDILDEDFTDYVYKKIIVPEEFAGSFTPAVVTPQPAPSVNIATGAKGWSKSATVLTVVKDNENVWYIAAKTGKSVLLCGLDVTKQSVDGIQLKSASLSSLEKNFKYVGSAWNLDTLFDYAVEGDGLDSFMGEVNLPDIDHEGIVKAVSHAKTIANKTEVVIGRYTQTVEWEGSDHEVNVFEIFSTSLWATAKKITDNPAYIPPAPPAPATPLTFQNKPFDDYKQPLEFSTASASAGIYVGKFAPHVKGFAIETEDGVIAANTTLEQEIPPSPPDILMPIPGDGGMMVNNSGAKVAAGVVTLIKPKNAYIVPAEGVNFNITPILDDLAIVLVMPLNEFGGKKYTLPKGTVEPNESLHVAAVREVWEETGLAVEAKSFLTKIKATTSDVHFYIGYATSGIPSNTKGGGSEETDAVYIAAFHEHFALTDWYKELSTPNRYVVEKAWEWVQEQKKKPKPAPTVQQAGDNLSKQTATPTLWAYIQKAHAEQGFSTPVDYWNPDTMRKHDADLSVDPVLNNAEDVVLLNALHDVTKPINIKFADQANLGTTIFVDGKGFTYLGSIVVINDYIDCLRDDVNGDVQYRANFVGTPKATMFVEDNPPTHGTPFITLSDVGIGGPAAQAFSFMTKADWTSGSEAAFVNKHWPSVRRLLVAADLIAPAIKTPNFSIGQLCAAFNAPVSHLAFKYLSALGVKPMILMQVDLDVADKKIAAADGSPLAATASPMTNSGGSSKSKFMALVLGALAAAKAFVPDEYFTNGPSKLHPAIKVDDIQEMQWSAGGYAGSLAVAVGNVVKTPERSGCVLGVLNVMYPADQSQRIVCMAVVSGAGVGMHYVPAPEVSVEMGVSPKASKPLMPLFPIDNYLDVLKAEKSEYTTAFKSAAYAAKLIRPGTDDDYGWYLARGGFETSPANLTDLEWTYCVVLKSLQGGGGIPTAAIATTTSGVATVSPAPQPIVAKVIGPVNHLDPLYKSIGDALPDPAMFKIVGTGAAGGSNPNFKAEGPGGTQWFLKTGKNADKGRVVGEAAVYPIARKLTTWAVPSSVMLKDGKLYSVNPFIEGGKSVPDSPDKLSTGQKARLLAQHAVDMYFCDHDGNTSNWMMKDDQLIPIDRGQSLKGYVYPHGGKAGPRLAPDYTPPGTVGVNYAKTLLSRWGEQKSDIPESAFNAMKVVIDRIAKISNTDIDASVDFLAKWTKGAPDELTDAKVKQVKTAMKKARDSYVADWTDALKAIRPDFAWPSSNAAGAAILNIEPKEMGLKKEHEKVIKEAVDAGWQGKSLFVDKGFIENMEVLVKQVLYPSDASGYGTLIYFRVSAPGGQKAEQAMGAVAVEKAFSPGVAMAVPFDTAFASYNDANFHAIIVRVTKHLNSHLLGWSNSAGTHKPENADKKIDESLITKLKDAQGQLVQLANEAKQNPKALVKGVPASIIEQMADYYISQIKTILAVNADRESFAASGLGNKLVEYPQFKFTLTETEIEDLTGEKKAEPKPVDIQYMKGQAFDPETFAVPPVPAGPGKLPVLKMQSADAAKASGAGIVGQYRITCAAIPGARIYYTPTSAKSGSDSVRSYFGQCWGFIPGEASSQNVARLLRTFEVAAEIDMKSATPADKEILYLSKQAFVLQGVSSDVNPDSSGDGAVDPTYKSALAAYRNGDTDTARKGLRDFIQSRISQELGDSVTDLDSLPNYGKFEQEGFNDSGGFTAARLGWTEASIRKTFGKNAFLAHHLMTSTPLAFFSTIAQHNGGFVAPYVWSIAGLKLQSSADNNVAKAKANGSVWTDLQRGAAGTYVVLHSGKVKQAGYLYFDIAMLLRTDVYVVSRSDGFGSSTAERVTSIRRIKDSVPVNNSGVSTSTSYQINVRNVLDVRKYLHTCYVSSYELEQLKSIVANAWGSDVTFAQGRSIDQVFLVAS